MARSKVYIIVGCGHAGISAAQELRRLDHKADIILVDEDPDAYYYRAAMKFYLKGELPRDNLKGRSAKFLQKQDIKILSQEVTRVTVADSSVTLADGAQLPYTKLLLATGADPFMPPIPGIDLPGVLPMRSLEETDAILQLAREHQGQPFTIVGAGVLGMELAEALTKYDVEVHVVALDTYLAPRLFNEGAAAVMAQHFRDHEVALHFNELVQEIQPQGDHLLVKTKNGLEIPSRAVFVTAGVRARTALARNAGIETNRGILVNARMETSQADVYAAGDCVEFREGESVQLWAPAGQMGLIAAANMHGQGQAFSLECVHAYTLLFDRTYHAIGEINPPDAEGAEFLTREASAPGDYFQLILRDERLVGVVALGEIHDPLVLKRVIEAGNPIPAEFKGRLTDKTFDYELLL